MAICTNPVMAHFMNSRPYHHTQHYPRNGPVPMTLEDFKTWLKGFDRNGDGRISAAELREAMRAQGVWFTGWKYQGGMMAADRNGNGFIEDDEMNNLKDFALKHLGIIIVYADE